MKTPEQWLEELRLYDNWISDTTALRLIQAIQKDAVDCTTNEVWERCKEWHRQKAIMMEPHSP